jgi:hypothetical protein
MDLKGGRNCLFKGTDQLFSWKERVKNHEKLQSRWQVILPKFETRTFRIRNRKDTPKRKPSLCRVTDYRYLVLSLRYKWTELGLKQYKANGGVWGCILPYAAEGWGEVISYNNNNIFQRGNQCRGRGHVTGMGPHVTWMQTVHPLPVHTAHVLVTLICSYYI